MITKVRVVAAVVITTICTACFSGSAAFGKVPNVTMGRGSGASPDHAITVKAPNGDIAVDAASYWAVKKAPGYKFETYKYHGIPPKEMVRVELRGPGGKRKSVYFRVMNFTNDESNGVIDSLNKMTDSLAKDKRQPTARNLSGVWSSGMDLVGITMQLNQRGDVVTGYGNHWACAGPYGMFELRGTVRHGILRLTLQLSNIQKERRTYRVSGARDAVELRRTGSESLETLWPQGA